MAVTGVVYASAYEWAAEFEAWLVEHWLWSDWEWID